MSIIGPAIVILFISFIVVFVYMIMKLIKKVLFPEKNIPSNPEIKEHSQVFVSPKREDRVIEYYGDGTAMHESGLIY